jgi:sulfate transport system permease protein
MNLARKKRVLPGFGLSLGYTMTYLSLIVLIPLGVLVFKSAKLSPDLIWKTLTDPATVAAFKLTLWTSAVAGVISAVFGLIIAWTLVRYRFPGRRILDAVIDLPFALPTAVAGLTFSNLYMPDGWIGSIWPKYLALSNTSGGIVIVLTFVGFPFVVRAVQPVLQEWQTENEQAAASLGANRWTTFWRIIFPEIRPAMLTGLALAFARAVGEYGSVIFISTNLPGKGEIVPTRIVTELFSNEENDLGDQRAHIIAAALLMISLLVLLTINILEWWTRRRVEAAQS